MIEAKMQSTHTGRQTDNSERPPCRQSPQRSVHCYSVTYSRCQGENLCFDSSGLSEKGRGGLCEAWRPIEWEAEASHRLREMWIQRDGDTERERGGERKREGKKILLKSIALSVSCLQLNLGMTADTINGCIHGNLNWLKSYRFKDSWFPV